ncbi:hypothetical protein A2U01_0029151, partial [Trifolium medium]|nr:hypothetical protein [Trifolium medium]
NNSCENLAHHENSSQNANPKSEQSVVPNVAICGELPSCVNQSEKAVQDFGAPEVLKLITTLEEKEAALVNLKKALEEKEAALMERDAALKDALAREETMKQDYPEVLKKITALEMAMTEQQKSVEDKEAALVYLKKELVEMEAALTDMDAALKDALAREKKVKQDYPEVRKLIAALQMAM